MVNWEHGSFLPCCFFTENIVSITDQPSRHMHRLGLCFGFWSMFQKRRENCSAQDRLSPGGAGQTSIEGSVRPHPIKPVRRWHTCPKKDKPSPTHPTQTGHRVKSPPPFARLAIPRPPNAHYSRHKRQPTNSNRLIHLARVPLHADKPPARRQGHRVWSRRFRVAPAMRDSLVASLLLVNPKFPEIP